MNTQTKCHCGKTATLSDHNVLGEHGAYYCADHAENADVQALKLRAWTAANEEWVIAFSAEDAAIIYGQTGAEPLDDVPWTVCPDDKMFTFRDEDAVPTEVKKTMGEWAKERGRGYFGSANY